MSDFLRERMFGVRPVHRTNPQTGQSEWYYLDPRNNSRLADRPEIDVESENSPNPYANEIQQYLYENDEYNYKQLYGDTPPPSIQPVRTGINVDMNNLGNNGTNNGSDATGELNDYQRAMLNVAQAASKGSYMSGVSDTNTGFADTTGSNNIHFGTTENIGQNFNNMPVPNQTFAPWSNPATQISPVPWRDNQTLAPWAGGYDLSQSSSVISKIQQQPYIFSEDMRNRLGELESGNNYTKVNSEGGGIGALGKYQIRRDGFKDAGYINADNKWAGKNDINSADDYLNNSELQEQALNDFMEAKYRQLQNNGSRQYLGYPINGLVDNFDITDTGLLAASHREGAGAVHNYLSHLEKDKYGRYYINYDKITNPRQREMFKRIETRLRKFEK